jgi:hypothetical protein
VLSWHDAQLLKYCATPALSDCAAAAVRHTIAEVITRSHTSQRMVFMVRKIISICQDSLDVNIRVMVEACLDFFGMSTLSFWLFKLSHHHYLLCSRRFFNIAR